MADSVKKNSLLCPNCRGLISRHEKVCPYCKERNPGSWLKNNLIVSAFSDNESIVRIITYINIIMFLLSILIDPRSSNFSINPFGFFSPSHESLKVLGSTGTVPILHYNRWWSLISANYLHGGLLHILFNMIALRQIGPFVANEYGANRMFIIYTMGGVLGFLLSFVAGIRFTIGASAAVCALIGAILYYGKSRGGIYGQHIYVQIRGWALWIFIFGFLVPGINNWGHGGGMAAGVLLGYLLGYKEKKRENVIHKIFCFCCVVTTAFVLVWSAFNGVLYLV